MSAEDQGAWYESMNHEEDDEEEDDDDDEDVPCYFPKSCECGDIKCLIVKAQLEKYQNQANDSGVYETVPTLVDSNSPDE